MRKWARGRETDYDYDWLGQLQKVDYDGTDTPDVTWSLPDSRGRYTKLTDGAGEHTISYDARGAMTADEVTTGLLSG
jgi:YD repeat-containing protein